MTGASLTAHRLAWSYPVAILRFGLAASLLFICAVIYLAPWAVPYLPALPLGAAAGAYLFRRPRINLYVVLGIFVFVAGLDEGITIGEIAFALLYIGYLGQWYFQRVILANEPLVRSTLDRMVLILFLFVSAYGVVGPPLQGSFHGCCCRDPIVVARPLLLSDQRVHRARQAWTQGAVHNACLDGACSSSSATCTSSHNGLLSVTEVWHVTVKGRVVFNEMLMIVPAIVMFLLAIEVKKLGNRLGLLFLFLMMAFGILITQGRGNWLGFGFGLGILFLFSTGQIRRSMIGWFALAVAGCVGLLFLIFREHAILLLSGTVNRVLSIGSATSRDTSFIARLVEWRAAFEMIKVNPILGYGPGYPARVL